jgi:predicted Zn finger-like uncharacterized protein
MRIACPSCNAAYDVPPERLAAGRVVKCARCAESWIPIPVAAGPVAAIPAEAPAIDPVPQPTMDAPTMDAPAMDEAAPSIEPPAPKTPPPEPLVPPAEPPRRSRAPLVAAWLLSIAVLAALGWAAIDRRADIMAAWPPSTRAYAAIGLATPR